MFKVSPSDIQPILKDFGILSKVFSITELQRYYYEKNNPESKEVRLIDKVVLTNGSKKFGIVYLPCPFWKIGTF